MTSGTLSFQRGAPNSGNVSVASGATLAAAGYIQTGGSSTLNGGTLAGGPFSINAGALLGSGTINANVTNGGQVIPGGTGAAGTSTINGNYTQTATGTLDIDIGGTTAGSQYDQLAVSGTASLGGTVNVATDQRLPARPGRHVPAPDFRLVHRELRLLQRDRPRQPPDPRPHAESHKPDAHRPAGRDDDDPRRPAFALGLRPERDLHGRRSPSPCRRPRSIPVPTGTVTFYDDGTPIGTGTLAVVGGQDQASLHHRHPQHGQPHDHRRLHQRRCQLHPQPRLDGRRPRWSTRRTPARRSPRRSARRCSARR